MKLLLDTHAFLWVLYEPHHLSETASRSLQDPENQLFISAATAWEIATKHRLGRLDMAAPLLERYEAVLLELGAQEISVTSRHALRAGTLQVVHGDPFDRILAAQSLLEGMPLVSQDRAFEAFPDLATVW